MEENVNSVETRNHAEHLGDASHVCGVCGSAFSPTLMRPVSLVSRAAADELAARTKDWRRTGWVCLADLRDARNRAIEAMIREERGELTVLDREVLESLAASSFVVVNPDDAYERRATVGERLADAMAMFAGSWTFIGTFVAALLVWIAWNLAASLGPAFDPYPFILLNLILSCVAALQAPLIMMSQKRQEAKDRLRSESDYRINLKAELEIRRLHEKLDHHLMSQWERLSEIQAEQFDALRQAQEQPPAESTGQPGPSTASGNATT